MGEGKVSGERYKGYTDTGALYSPIRVTNKSYTGANDGNYDWCFVALDASRFVSVYTTDGVVRPNSLTFNAVVKY